MYFSDMTDGVPSQPVVHRIQPVLLVAGATAASYWFAYNYQVAYLQHFGLPAALAKVSVTSSVIAGSALVAAAWVGLLYWALLRRTDLENDRQVQYASIAVSCTSFMFITHFWLYVGVKWWPQLISLGLTFLAETWLMLARRRARNRQEQGLPPIPLRDGPLRTALEPYVDVDVVILAASAVLMGTSLSFSAGQVEALKQVEFLTLVEPDGFIVVRAYDDVFVAAKLNRERAKVGPEYVVLPINKGGAVRMHRERLGRLEAASSIGLKSSDGVAPTVPDRPLPAEPSQAAPPEGQAMPDPGGSVCGPSGPT